MAGVPMTRLLRLAAIGLASDRKERRELPRPATRPGSGLRRFSVQVRRPIFVLGAPRSGTTFLGSCIGRLPDVSYHFEPRVTKAVARNVYDGSWSPGRARRWFRGYYGALLAAAGHGGLRFAEKDPENCFIVPFLVDTFPDAMFLHVIRDGRDVAVSHAEQPWLAAASAGTGRRGRAGTAWGPHARFWVEPDRREEFAAASDLTRTAWMWRRFTDSALDQLAALPPERVLELRYESAVQDPAATAERVADFLSVDATGRRALHDGFGTARRGSVGRWRSTLDPVGRADVDKEAGALLTRLGYL
jgi:hypothetical protein